MPSSPFAKTRPLFRFGMPESMRAKMRVNASALLACERSQFVARDGDEQFDVSFASGGSKATLAGIGFILAAWVAGMFNWRWIIGTSGGFTPAAGLAARIYIKILLRLIIHTDFGTLVFPKAGKLRRLWAMLRIQRYHVTMPAKGVMCSDNLRQFMDSSLVQHCETPWPDRLIVPATDEDGCLVFFAASGLIKILPDGSKIQVESSPRSLGTAAVATSAVPGIFDSVPVGKLRLVDGVIAGGASPIEPLVHFGGEKRRLMIFDVGEDGIKKVWWMRWLWLAFSLGLGGPIDTRHVEESPDVMVIRCTVNGFHGLQFSLPVEDKWRAIIAGYLATVKRWQAAKMVSASTHPQLYELAKVFANLLTRPNDLASEVAKALSERDLF